MIDRLELQDYPSIWEGSDRNEAQYQENAAVFLFQHTLNCTVNLDMPVKPLCKSTDSYVFTLVCLFVMLLELAFQIWAMYYKLSKDCFKQV